MSLYSSFGDSVSGAIESVESTLSPLTDAIGAVQDIFFPNKNTTDTRKRFSIDANEWNTPKLNFQFYVLFYVNDFATIYNAYTGGNIDKVQLKTRVAESPKDLYGSYGENVQSVDGNTITYTTDPDADKINELADINTTDDVLNTVSDYNDYNEGLFAKFDGSHNSKVKSDYYLNVIESLAKAQGLADEMSMWVVSCTRPSWATNFDEYNQYNRKRLVPTGTTYKPIVMNVWDDVASHVAKLLTYQLAIADNTFFNKTQADFDQFTQLDRFMNGWNEWGLSVYSGVSIFKMIQIVEIWQNKVTAYTIHNPKIVNVEMSSHDLSGQSQGMGFNLTFDYEGMTISNPADSDVFEPLMGSKITKDLAKKCRMQYLSRFDQLANSAAGLINNLATGKSLKSSLKDFGTSMGYGQTINAVSTAVNTVKNIVPKKANSNEIIKTAGSAAVLGGQALVNMTSFEG